MRRIIYMTSLLMLITFFAIAQGESSLAFQYSMNFPLGSTSDYVKETSFRGATIDYRYKIQPMVGVGASLAWYTFNEAKPYDSYAPSDDLIVSGRQYRYLNSVPVLFVADYYFRPDEKVSPFAGLGIGTTYNELNTQMGLYEVTIDTWHFTLAPEIGAMFGIRPGVSGYLSARYNYSFKTGELDEQSYLTVNVGLAFGTAVFSSQNSIE